MKTKQFFAALILSGFTTIVAAQAQNPQGGGQGGQHKGPPAEAIDACKDKASGDSCSFTGRKGKAVAGTCFTPQSSRPLACKPAQGTQGAKPQ